MFTTTITGKGQMTLLNATAMRVQAQAVVNAVSSFKQEPGGFADHLSGEMKRLTVSKTTSPFDKAASRSPEFTSIP